MNRTPKLLEKILRELLQSYDLPASITIEEDVERTGDTSTESEPSISEGQASSDTEVGSTHQDDNDGDGSHA